MQRTSPAEREQPPWPIVELPSEWHLRRPAGLQGRTTTAYMLQQSLPGIAPLGRGTASPTERQCDPLEKREPSPRAPLLPGRRRVWCFLELGEPTRDHASPRGDEDDPRKTSQIAQLPPLQTDFWLPRSLREPRA